MVIAAKAQLSSRPEVMAAIVGACRCVGGREGGSRGEADSLDLSDPFDAEVVSACSELFNNVVRHGYDGGSEDSVEIEVEPHPDRVVIRMTDYGKPFDPGEIPEPDLNLLPEGGLGIYIVHAFVDRASYEAGPPNRWTLEKSYRSSKAKEAVE